MPPLQSKSLSYSEFLAATLDRRLYLQVDRIRDAFHRCCAWSLGAAVAAPKLTGGPRTRLRRPVGSCGDPGLIRCTRGGCVCVVCSSCGRLDVSNTGVITASDLATLLGNDYGPAEVKAMLEVCVCGPNLCCVCARFSGVCGKGAAAEGCAVISCLSRAPGRNLACAAPPPPSPPRPYRR
jgi:hypothetical protein